MSLNPKNQSLPLNESAKLSLTNVVLPNRFKTRSWDTYCIKDKWVI